MARNSLTSVTPTIPDKYLPRARTHPVRATTAALTEGCAYTAAAREAIANLDVTLAERRSAAKAAQQEAISRKARGEAVTIPALPSEADDEAERDLADRVLTEAERNEARLRADRDAAVAAAAVELAEPVVSAAHSEAGKALAAAETLRMALNAALAPRALALDLRSTEAHAALVAAGLTDGKEYIPDESMNNSPYTSGGNYHRSVPVTVADKARRAATRAFATAPPISEIAGHLDALIDGLKGIAQEDAAAPWPKNVLPADIAQALGLPVPPPPKPEPLETREEYMVRYRRAIANRDPIPTLPEHLGGLL